MKKTILAFALIAVVLFSGCTGDEDEESPYDNNVITIESFYASDKAPYEGSTVIVEFLVQNNGEETVPMTKIGADAPGFYIQDMYCDGGRTSRAAEDTMYCVFEDNGDYSAIESLDYRQVIITLEVKEVGILREKTYSMNYYVEYDYSGMRQVNIPIIDGVTKTKPDSEYSQSSSTYGPISVSFDLPESGQYIVDGETVPKYWGFNDNPFKVTMDFRDVGSSSIGLVSDTVLEKYNVRLYTMGSLDISDSVVHCDFDGYDDGMRSKKDITVPDDLVCTFQSTVYKYDSSAEPETTATIVAEFDYTYKYSNSQDFTIQPLPQNIGDESDTTSVSRP